MCTFLSYSLIPVVLQDTGNHPFYKLYTYKGEAQSCTLRQTPLQTSNRQGMQHRLLFFDFTSFPSKNILPLNWLLAKEHGKAIA